MKLISILLLFSVNVKHHRALYMNLSKFDILYLKNNVGVCLNLNQLLLPNTDRVQDNMSKWKIMIKLNIMNKLKIVKKLNEDCEQVEDYGV